MNTEHTYDFVSTHPPRKTPKDKVVAPSVDSTKKLLEEIKELQKLLATYKATTQKLIVEKNLLLDIIKGIK
jgi:hypothetical protein